MVHKTGSKYNCSGGPRLYGSLCGILAIQITVQWYCEAFSSVFEIDRRKSSLFSNPAIKLFATGNNNDNRDERDVYSLDRWSREMGVEMVEGMKLSSGFGANDWGFETEGLKSSKPGDTVLSVPRTLVMSSKKTMEDLGGMDVFQPGFGILTCEGVEEYRPQFLLMVKVLYEMAQDARSVWHPWLLSLPKEFTTGTYMDDFERQFLSPISLALAEFEDHKLQSFRAALYAIRDKIDVLDSFLDGTNDDVIKWAFNVVFSRSWIYSDSQDAEIADANIVPLGDMFNHREPADVFVSDVENTDFVELRLLHDIDSSQPQQLFLSYGLNNPHRFLIIFGFVDESMPEIFSQIVFTNPCPELIELGCEDRSKMVYRTEDGLIANAVWDSILYALLHSKPEQQKALYDAHVKGDKQLKAELHAKYALEVLISLRKHVNDTRSHFESKLSSAGKVNASVLADHPRLESILKMNKFVSSVLEKVSFRVERMIESEVAKRRRQVMST